MTETNVVYVSGHDNLIGRFFEKNLGYDVTYDSSDYHNVFCLSGGGDISPGLYGQDNKHAQGILIKRDMEEIEDYFHALMRRIPIIGICRGAQLLWVLNGGILHQHRQQIDMDMDGFHPMRQVDPEIEFSDFKNMMVNSTHHQMMAYHPMSSILGNIWISNNRNPFHKDDPYLDDNANKANAYGTHVEMFSVVSKKILAMQFHPEYSRFPEETKKMVIEEIKRTCADFAE